MLSNTKVAYSITAPFNNMQTLKFKSQTANVCVATVIIIIKFWLKCMHQIKILYIFMTNDEEISPLSNHLPLYPYLIVSRYLSIFIFFLIVITNRWLALKHILKKVSFFLSSREEYCTYLYFTYVISVPNMPLFGHLLLSLIKYLILILLRQNSLLRHLKDFIHAFLVNLHWIQGS